MLCLRACVILLMEFVVYVPKMPLWVEPMPSLVHVNPRFLTSLTLLVFCQIKFQHYKFFENQEVNEKLCIGEVGVDLEPCIHAHGHDADLIMEASCKNNYPLGISSSHI